ncbi:AraC family transcriptional regulator [Paenibacillus anaericanus]|uniref:AraC family transcriptional regulator n=1 Tax=Paenibacillus anaericanus TaxID=170367 RepID=A0A3S1DED4_9BACL|nr:AraC family transcriptional regulator [Paenibacillus anaericanus]RUT42948.1 AraC family transcriptional regulator [Paenibacillus anaericanus]
MLHWTEGRVYHPGYRISVAYNPEELLSDHEGVTSVYCIILIKEGTGILQMGANMYPVIAPGMYCFNDKEAVRLITGTALRAESLRFRPSVVHYSLDDLIQVQHVEGQKMETTEVQDLWCMEPFFERTDSYHGGISLDPSVAKHADDLFHQIGQNLMQQSDINWPCRSRSYLMELLFLIRRLYQTTDFVPSAVPHVVPESVKLVIEYLHTNYKQKIKLDDLTAIFHANKTTLNEHFKKSTGLSLIAYLNKIRMQMADSMLRNTTLPTTEIMERIGIHDDAHFLRNFRKYSGYSPAEYRTKYCWMLNGTS